MHRVLPNRVPVGIGQPCAAESLRQGYGVVGAVRSLAEAGASRPAPDGSVPSLQRQSRT